MINKDFKPLPKPATTSFQNTNANFALHRRPRLYLIAAISAAVCLTIYMLLPLNDSMSLKQGSSSSINLKLPSNPSGHSTISPLGVSSNSQPPITTPKPTPLSWSKHTVKSGDNLALIFSDLGLTPRLLHQIIQSGPVAKKLQNIKPGQQLRVAKNSNGQFNSLEYDIDRSHTIQVNRLEDVISSAILEKKVNRKQSNAFAVINNSLYYDGKQAGLSDKTIMELANIFGWDIDFALNLRKGDSFTVLYETQFIDNERIEDGKILAAEFTNRGQTYQAVRFEYADGNSEYFSPSGKSMRKSFLRSPIDFARISSRFNLKRKHPVLNRIRAHRGVDYAASTGTPIKTTGNGRIIYRGVKGGFGRVVIVKHGEKYNTLYAHMSKYGRYKKGSHVKQGQVIGYVGSSGLATGPHLHYEFRMNGVHRNPLTVKFPSAKPISKKLLATFMQQTSPLLTRLEQAKATHLAVNQTLSTKN